MGEKGNLAADATSAGAGLLDRATGAATSSATSVAEAYKSGLENKLVEGAVAGTVTGVTGLTAARNADDEASGAGTS